MPLTNLAEVFAHERLHTYKKGELISAQGESLHDIRLIHSGMVKVYDIDAKGEEHIISIFVRHNIFPFAWLLMDRPMGSLYFYQAYTDTTCYNIPHQKLLKYLSDNSDIALLILDVLVKEYLNNANRIKHLERARVPERMQFILYYLATKLGEPVGDGIVRVDAHITHEDIAALSGVTRESISNEIAKDYYRNVIWRIHGKTFIDTNKIVVDSAFSVFA